MGKSTAKSKSFSDTDKEVLRAKKLDWRFYEPLQLLPGSMIIKHKITGEVKMVERRKIPN